MTFNIALLQILPSRSIEGNINTGIQACQKAKKMGADLALFPELWQIGYNTRYMNKNYAHQSSDFLKIFKALAQELQMAIAITYLGKGPTNHLCLIDRKGKILFDYTKVYICNFKGGTEQNLEAGKEFKVTTLHYEKGSVQIGAMICFDREFPESARTLMQKGAKIIITANACLLKTCPTLKDMRLAAFRTRAFENKVGVAMANYPAPKNDGHSCAFNVDGTEILMLGKKEKIKVACFDVDFIRKWQQKEPWGFLKQNF